MTLQISEPKLKPDASEKLLHKKSANSTIIFLHILESTRENICFSKSDRIFISRTLIFDASLSIHLVAYIVSRQENMWSSQWFVRCEKIHCSNLNLSTFTFKKDTKIPCIYFLYRWKVRKGSVQEKIEQCERDLMF